MSKDGFDEQALAEELAKDGKAVRAVGFWHKRKHHFLRRYIDAFTTSMHEKWGSLHYIDPFAGPGLCRVEPEQDLTLGSPLIAAVSKKPFTYLHLGDADEVSCEALHARVEVLRERLNQSFDYQILHGDANSNMDEMISTIPDQGALSLALLDPTGLHLKFQTLRKLCRKQVDLIIYFPDHVDVMRNYQHYYWPNLNSPLDQALGCNWRPRIAKAQSGGHDRIIKEFRSIYRDQLRTLGYSHFGEEGIEGPMGDLYVLIFASKHETALHLWNRVSTIEHGGQRRLGFGE